jgi:hypothetical protein
MPRPETSLASTPKSGCPTLAGSLFFRLGLELPPRRGRFNSPRGTLPFAALTCVLPLAGCGRAPSFNILGSFFPAWLICMVVGILLAAIVNWILTALKLEKLISWSILTYPCLAAFFAFTLWLIFFS